MHDFARRLLVAGHLFFKSSNSCWRVMEYKSSVGGSNVVRNWRGSARIFKTVVQGLVPPYLTLLYSRLVRLLIPPPTIVQELQQDVLFEGDDQIFKSLLNESVVYAEFGCGRSTVWATLNTNCKIVSVDTSLEWSETVSRLVNERGLGDRLEIRFVDLGVIGDWGMPLTFDRRQNNWNYVNAPWDQVDRRPDTILIDGRFRIACFLNCLLKATPGTRIVFDDYFNRDYYHVVEEFCSVSQRCGRQAVFIVPDSLDRGVIESELLRFMYVRE